MSREQELFCAAVERPAGAERAAFLDAACAGEPELRARVEALLRAASAAGSFLAEDEARVREEVGAHIGRYVLRERIGEGGFGVVYRAQQVEPVRRDVALKIIKLGMDTRAVVARFEAERQALALMEHAHIARVLDGGATDAGRPYFVMELVRGVPVTIFCNERRLTVHERLELFLQVCRAVHHAHQKGIIHRDLKPSNILVTLDEEQRAVAKVIDFGIAKATRGPLTDGTLLTRRQMLLGTPAYMSPEQVGVGSSDVDTRSDIYSLGALLYELLADVPVLEAKMLSAGGYVEISRAIQLHEPPALSQRVASLAPEARFAAAERRATTAPRWIAELRGDLDRIVAKCLEKERARRYETTEDLARDITRFLRNEPVLARPATLRYRAAKFVGRHRRGVIAGAAAAMLLSTLGGYHAQRLAAERDRARLEAQKAAKVSELLTEIVTSADPFRTPTQRGMLEESASRVRREFAAQPEVRVEILNAIGRVHLRRGEHEKALPVLTESLVAGRELGRADLRVAQTLSDLGILRRERGEYAAALPLFEEALAMRRALFADNHNDVAISMVELGRLLRTLEQLDRAEKLFRDALAIRRRVLGPEHREVATSLGDVGMLLWHQGELAAAEQFVMESIALHRKTVGAEHPNVGQSLANLALVKSDQGDLAAAETLLREALAIVTKAMGGKHWRTARIMGQLGETLRARGRLEEAAELLERALAAVDSGTGAEPAVAAALKIDRARVHLARGEAAAAETLLRDALRTQRERFSEENWRVASTKSLLGAALAAQERRVEAEQLLRAANAVLRDGPGPRGRETQPTRERLAALTRMASAR